MRIGYFFWRLSYFGLTIFISHLSNGQNVSSEERLLAQANQSISRYDYAKAVLFLDSCLSRSEGPKPGKYLEMLKKRADCFSRLGLPRNAKTDYRELLRTSIASKDEKGQAEAYVLMANACTANSEYDSCIHYANQALGLSAKIRSAYFQIRSNLALGVSYQLKFIIEKANAYFLEAQRISLEVHDQKGIAESLSNLAVVQSELKNQEEALPMQKEAFAKLYSLGQYLESGNALMRIGICFKRMKKYDSAAIYYKKALAFGDRFNEVRISARAYHNLSDVYAYQEKYDSSLYFNEKAIKFYKEVDSKTGIVLSQNARGQLFRIMGDQGLGKENYTKAIPFFKEDLVLARQIGLRDFVAKCNEELSFCYQGLGDYQKAYEHLNEYFFLNDSIRNEKTTNTVNELQIKYESKQKEIDIVRLNSEKLIGVKKLENQRVVIYSLIAIALLLVGGGYLVFINIQKKRKAEYRLAVLEKQNAIETMRSKIAGDVHDDMGANLTKLGLNAQQLVGLANDENQKELAEKMAAQSKEVMVGMKEIIWASNPANDNLKSMLGFMRQYIDRFFDGTDIRPVVRFPNEVGEITLHPEVRRNLFLILKESLNNAVKYSGTDRVDIDFTNQNESFNLQIKDYGKGMDGDKKDDFKNGLVNMKARAEQIAAAFRLVTEPGQGVEILVEGRLY